MNVEEQELLKEFTPEQIAKLNKIRSLKNTKVNPEA